MKNRANRRIELVIATQTKTSPLIQLARLLFTSVFYFVLRAGLFKRFHI